MFEMLNGFTRMINIVTIIGWIIIVIMGIVIVVVWQDSYKHPSESIFSKRIMRKENVENRTSKTKVKTKPRKFVLWGSL